MARHQYLDLHSQLYSTEVVFRPPMEAASILLEVATGCPYSRCIFCREAALRRWHVNTLGDIERRAQLCAMIPTNHRLDKVFLLGEDTLYLDAPFLNGVLEIVKREMPWVRSCATYARCMDILKKSAEELAGFKERGLVDLYVGIESGNEEILRRIRKGVHVEQMHQALEKLDMVGLSYNLSSIMGIGGKSMTSQNAHDTAAFYNVTHPKTIRLMSLQAKKDTILWKEIRDGKFSESTPKEVVLEERLLVSELTVEGCDLYANHISNLVPICGRLPLDREKMIARLDRAIASGDLDAIKPREFDLI
jgi:radical SAM superfamily enzyme YgiQ (UPF0313 family)